MYTLCFLGFLACIAMITLTATMYASGGRVMFQPSLILAILVLGVYVEYCKTGGTRTTAVLPLVLFSLFQYSHIISQYMQSFSIHWAW